MADSSRASLPPLPQEDLALLSGLQPHEVRAVAESKIQAYRVMIENINGYIVQLSTIQNTTVPLHASLPPEVLMNVFRHILPTCRSDLRLTHVCKLWQDLIYRTPEFWVDMLAVCAVTWRPIDHTTVPSYILRSSPLPYKLTITGEYDFLLDMPSLASRMSSLSVHVPRTINSIYHLAQLLHLHMPLLETMRCRAYGENPSWLVDRTQLPPPRGQNFPRLRKLALHGADLPSRALAFPYLEELTFDDGTYSDSLLPLLVFLENCPQLRMLDMNIRAPDWEADLDHDPVPLPHLQICSLRIHDPSGSWAYDFLERVHVPATAQLKVINWLAGSAAALNELIPSSPPASVEVLQAINAVTIHFQYDRNDRNHKWTLFASGFVPGDPKPHLELTIHDPCYTDFGEELPSGALSDLALLFSNSPSLDRLRLRLDSGIAVTADDWCTILHAFRSLSSLTVHIDSCRHLLTALRKHPSEWPALRRLSISCHNGSGVHEGLLSAIEKRAREGLGLKYLAFSGSYKKPLSAHRMRRLRELVEEVTEVDELEL